MKEHEYSELQIYRRLLAIARPYWWHVAWSFVVSLLATPIALLQPLPLKLVVDSVIGSEPVPRALAAVLPSTVVESRQALRLVAVALLVSIAAASQLQGLGVWLLQSYAGDALALRFRSLLFRHLQRLSLSYHDKYGTGHSTHRIQYDSQSIQQIVVDGLIPFVTAAATLVSMFYVCARLDRTLALIAMAVTLPLSIMVRTSRARLRDQWRENKSFQSATISILQETMGALRVVKAFGQEDRAHDRFYQQSDRMIRGRFRIAMNAGAFDVFSGLVTAAGTAGVLTIGVRHVISGQLTLGALLVVIAYLGQLYAPLLTITRKVRDLQEAFVGARRALTVLDEAPEVVERPGARPLAVASGSIAFQDVSFAYEPERLVLDRVSFRVEQGSRVGIAGRTGAGKTTLTNLLMRFYDPTAGAIVLDGVDLRDYRLADLRNQFAIVLQEPILFSTTIAENISYGRPDASYAQVVEAAKAANVHDFVAGLPDGYESVVGERGMQLSGGERQRISLARAFLKDAPILILDEPTSAVDIQTEAYIMEAMERLMRNRTTFMIAHRVSTLERCDVRLTLDKGRLVNYTVASATGAQHSA